jgi:hypothetical protein
VCADSRRLQEEASSVPPWASGPAGHKFLASARTLLDKARQPLLNLKDPLETPDGFKDPN